MSAALLEIVVPICRANERVNKMENAYRTKTGKWGPRKPAGLSLEIVGFWKKPMSFSSY
jgi:hypothetical protein